MYMSDNSILWPNGIKVDSDGYAVFYQLGTNKVEVPSEDKWPEGVKLKSPFVYDENGELVGFVDTKAMIVNGPTTITLPYKEIKAKFTSIAEGDLIINAPNATVKEFTWAVASGEGGDGGVEIDFKYKGCKTVDDVKAKDANYQTTDIVDGVWSEGLGDLEDSNSMFYECTALTAFSSDLSSLTDGYSMFNACWNLTSFSSELPKLTNAHYMFGSTNLTSFSSDLSSLTDGMNMFSNCTSLTTFYSDLSSLTSGSCMFFYCENLTSFDSDLSSLTDGYQMFEYCRNLTTFTSNLSSLTNGYYMFQNCTNLTSFSSDLSSLTDGTSMFSGCKLDTASVQNIADTINTPSSKRTINISIGNSTPNSQEEEAFNTIASKNWTVYVKVKGGSSTQWNPTSLTPIDGEEQQTPIPFYAKPASSDEEHAQYVDAEGNFYNILGGNYIYGDDLSTYGMFTSEEDAAANMRLTKIEKGNK